MIGWRGALARSETRVLVINAARAEHVGVDVGIECGGQFNGEVATRELQRDAAATPTVRGHAKGDAARRDGCLHVAARERECGVALARFDLERAFDAVDGQGACARVDFQIERDGHAQVIIDLPRQAQQLLREIARDAFHKLAVVRPRRDERDVRQVFVEREAVDGGEAREVFFRVGVEFDVGGDVEFAARPSFDGDRTVGRAVDGQRVAVSEASCLVARRRARERGRGDGHRRRSFTLHAGLRVRYVADEERQQSAKQDARMKH